jgi:hypothetical protein
MEVTPARKALLIADVVLKERMVVRDELARELSLLKDSIEAGSVELSPAEISYLEENYLEQMRFEERDLEAYKAAAEELDYKITLLNNGDLAIGLKEGGRVMTWSREGSSMFTRDKWTNTLTTEKETEDGWPVRLYRYDIEGNRTLFAEYQYGSAEGGPVRIVLLKSNGEPWQRIVMASSASSWVRRMETRASDSKWIEWPPNPRETAARRISLLLADRNVW